MILVWHAGPPSATCNHVMASGRMCLLGCVSCPTTVVRCPRPHHVICCGDNARRLDYPWRLTRGLAPRGDEVVARGRGVARASQQNARAGCLLGVEGRSAWMRVSAHEHARLEPGSFEMSTPRCGIFGRCFVVLALNVALGMILTSRAGLADFGQAGLRCSQRQHQRKNTRLGPTTSIGRPCPSEIPNDPSTE